MSSPTITKAPPAAIVSANVTTAQLFPNKATPTIPAVIGVLGTGRLSQQKFTVRATGRATTGASSTAQATLYISNALPASAPLTAASWTVLCASTARTIATATGNFMIQAELEFQDLTGTMQGTFKALVNSLFDAEAIVTGTLTGLNGSPQSITQGSTVVPPADPVFYIVAGITFGTANVGNSANLGEFVLEG